MFAIFNLLIEGTYKFFGIWKGVQTHTGRRETLCIKPGDLIRDFFLRAHELKLKCKSRILIK